MAKVTTHITLIIGVLLMLISVVAGFYPAIGVDDSDKFGTLMTVLKFVVPAMLSTAYAIITILRLQENKDLKDSQNKLLESSQEGNAQREVLLKFEIKLGEVYNEIIAKTKEYIGIHEKTQKTILGIDQKLTDTNRNFNDLKMRFEKVEKSNLKIESIEKRTNSIENLLKQHNREIDNLKKRK